ncbi:2Fe-2S iron-sulfur cluster-binding protein [Taibaiella chishuiensis]|uniref:2Fe-2S iron-sulfur cluster protein n=1 Tax=Taibaiella chishuiensis TaxID=1434707 RepID=A0A2P8D1W8_9BACT|nr:2Fe-2S iron-sulfur cluster-binding protein [Taibaiella chishuiensis]PSK91214.1 2Fe-2S iron-sulfur cluster protein [Taibaiella chishuiensis]
MHHPETTTVNFTLVYRDRHYPVQVDRHACTSLMVLIADRLGIPGFGLCSGMGSCGTCQVTLIDARGQAQYAIQSCAMSINEALAQCYIFITE